MTNKMLSSLKFGQQGKAKDRYLRPPALNCFDVQIGQGLEGHFDSKIEGLSDVEEKSYFESEAEEPDHHDMQVFLGKMERLNRQQQLDASPSRSISRSLRLQDQPIIFVEEENQKSDHIGEHSIIIEHLDFNNEQHAPDTTPDWQHQQEKQQEPYMIKVNNKPAWLYSQNDSQTHREFESQDKLSPVRHSKNTCVDQKIVYEDTSIVVNKSCIDSPMGGKDLLDVNNKDSNIQAKQSRSISHILDKWKVAVFDEIKKEQRELPFNMERDARICRSRNREEIPQVEVQTDLQGVHIQQERDNLKQQIQTLSHKLQNIQQQNAKLKEKLDEKIEELNTLKTSWNQSRVNSQTNNKWFEESCRLESQKKELEKKLTMQNQVLKQFESKAQVLQKKLNQTVSCRPTTDSFPTTIEGRDYFRSMDLRSEYNFGESNHKKCQKKIEELQEHIFDIEQKVAGIDIEVQRRVQMVIEHIERQAQKRGSLQHYNIITKLKEQLQKAQKQLQTAQFQIKGFQTRQASMKDKQAEINRMYEELVQEWKELQFQKERRVSPKKEYTSTSQFHAYAPRAMTDRPQLHNCLSSRQFESLPTRRQKFNFLAYQPNISYEKQPVFLKSKPAWRREQSLSISTYADGGELLAINSKIQRLRKEINRELQSIN